MSDIYKSLGLCSLLMDFISQARAQMVLTEFCNVVILKPKERVCISNIRLPMKKTFSLLSFLPLRF